MTAGFNIRMPAAPRCWMCDADEGLRICSQDPWGGNTEYVCSGCFTGSDTGPCFDDLPALPKPRDYGPEPIDAKTAMGAVQLSPELVAEVMAANRPRLVRLALMLGKLSASDLMEPEETTE